jgi:chaperonin cofactor prefoldin
MVDERVFNKASLEEGIEVAEKVAEEIIKLTEGDFNTFKKFGEVYIKLNRVKELEKELSKADSSVKRQSKFSSPQRKRF